MRKRPNIKKNDNTSSWMSTIAYELGRTTKKTANTIDNTAKSIKRTAAKAKNAYEKGFEDALIKRAKPCTGRARARPDRYEDQISPILKEIQDIVNISGLNTALQEMNEISLQHSNNPVITRLTSKIKNLSPLEQENLAKKFMERINSRLYSEDNINALMLGQRKMTEDECQKSCDAFIDCMFLTLEDVGLIKEDKDHIKELTNDVTQPINNLMQFYTNPKTFSQKMKRLWTMQRIYFKTFKIIKKTHDVACEIEKSQKLPQRECIYSSN